MGDAPELIFKMPKIVVLRWMVQREVVVPILLSGQPRWEWVSRELGRGRGSRVKKVGLLAC